MNSVFDVGSPAAIFSAIAAGAAIKYVAGLLLQKPKEYRIVGKVGEIWIFPVKSMKGISLQEADTRLLGLEWKGIRDRHWVVTDADGKFLCQRRYPKMIFIEPVLCGKELELRAPGMEPVRFPINPQLNDSNLSKATVFSDTVPSLDMGDEVGKWLSHFLNKEGLRLQFSEASLQKRDMTVENKPWGNPAKKGDACAFADWASYLVLSEESVNFLNTKLEKPVPTTNFRPNIIVYDCEAFAEDSWSSIKIGESCLRALDSCTRCILTTVDQKTGTKDKDGEPLATLRKFRLKEPYGKKPIFGVNYAFDKPGTVRVGDPIYALQSHHKMIIYSYINSCFQMAPLVARRNEEKVQDGLSCLQMHSWHSGNRSSWVLGSSRQMQL